MKYSFQINWFFPLQSKLWSRTHHRVCSAPQDQHNILLHKVCPPLQFQGSRKDMDCGRQWNWQVYFSMEQSFSYCYNKTSWTLTIALGIAYPNDISLTSKESPQGRVCLESLTTEGPHALQQHSWVNPWKKTQSHWAAANINKAFSSPKTLTFQFKLWI